ncbi:hypothetical protein, partial [Cysteiniphilum litorale]|uniref:hypothetical protein n=1 Tax=Cysteiniphilum litorale TaxID=2056700 RepID=UPI001E2DBF7A
AIPTNLSRLDKSRSPENDFRNLFSNKPFNHRLSESFSAGTTEECDRDLIFFAFIVDRFAI